jgi:hypothetical protein
MRDGSIETQDGTRLIYVLSQLGKMIEQSEMQKSGGSKTYEDYLREMHEKIVGKHRRSLRSQGVSSRIEGQVSPDRAQHPTQT